MARQIGKMLNAREPKVVNGPEILNKFVGQSEENVRKLFADAEKEVSPGAVSLQPLCWVQLLASGQTLIRAWPLPQYKEKGDESGLHIIIFDELDAICKQRGSTNNGTGVGDSVVNQLLSKVRWADHAEKEAVLRPGRLTCSPCWFASHRWMALTSSTTSS